VNTAVQVSVIVAGVAAFAGAVWALLRGLARQSVSVDNAARSIDKLAEAIDRLERRVGDVEGRTRSLEDWRRAQGRRR
jgi:hypothetical protein